MFQALKNLVPRRDSTSQPAPGAGSMSAPAGAQGMTPSGKPVRKVSADQIVPSARASASLAQAVGPKGTALGARDAKAVSESTPGPSIEQVQAAFEEGRDCAAEVSTMARDILSRSDAPSSIRNRAFAEFVARADEFSAPPEYRARAQDHREARLARAKAYERPHGVTKEKLDQLARREREASAALAKNRQVDDRRAAIVQSLTDSVLDALKNGTTSAQDAAICLGAISKHLIVNSSRGSVAVEVWASDVRHDPRCSDELNRALY